MYIFTAISSEDSREPDIQMFPTDPAVCISSNVTFRCNSSLGSKNEISIMTGKQRFRKMNDVNKNGKQSVEFTLYNVSRSDNGLLVCCTLGDACNTSKEVVTMLNVRNVLYCKLYFPCIHLYMST
jgi:hypothetical protein